MSEAPTLVEERRLLRSGFGTVVGMDEVGRGALAGPVSVGAVVVDDTTGPVPERVRDSKMLTPRVREHVAPGIRQWAVAHAVGHASAEEIDAVGIIAALGLAGRRALAALPVRGGCVILDGSHDWLSQDPPQVLLADADRAEVAWPSEVVVPPVVTMVKADAHCAAVAAASVLAKVSRDALMSELSDDHPEYRWDRNKGYASAHHMEALRTYGPCADHRRSWRLPLR